MRTTVCFALLACWLVAHPYRGIVHDALLYTLPALSHLYPESLNQDLFLVHGSQDDFTIFSRIYAPLIHIWSVGLAAMLLLAVAHAVWIWGAARLVIRLIQNRTDSLWALAAVFCLPSFYGGMNALRYGEGFLTPRVLVEGVILHALAFAVSGRFVPAASLLCLAGLLHPLYALGGAAVLWLLLCFRDRRWLVLGVAAAIATASLAVAGTPVLERLRQSFDGEWWGVIRARNALVVPLEWTAMDWGRILLQLTLVSGAALRLKGRVRRLLLAVLILSLFSLAISIVGTSGLRNVLLTQVQIWRNLWLLAVCANAATGYLLASLWRELRNPVPSCSLIVLAWFWLPVPWILLPIVVACFGVFLWQFIRPATAVPRSHNVLYLLAVLVTTLAFSLIELNRVRLVAAGLDGPLRNLYAAFLSFGPLHAFLVGLMGFGLWRWGSWRPALTFGLALSACAATLLVWDTRTPWQKFLEAGGAGTIPFTTALERDAQVFWLHGARETWLWLRRPSYFSIEQGAGALFNRQTALTYAQRARELAQLLPRDYFKLTREGAEALGGAPPVLTAATLAATCRSSVDLDAIISGRQASGAPSVTWRAPVSRLVGRWEESRVTYEREQEFHLYRCSDLR